MDISPQQNVTRRKVFYISGFDPKGPAYYHTLYAEEAQNQAPLNGMTVEVGEPRRRGRLATQWAIRTERHGRQVDTSYEVLRWDDIMRKRMARRGPVFYWNIVRTYWLYLRTGALWRILKTSYPAFLAGLYPAAFLAGFVVLAVLAALGVFFGLSGSDALNQTAWQVPPIVAAVLAAAVFALVLWLAGRLERRVPFFWPLHVYTFAADHMRGRIPEMDQRIELFAHEILNYSARSEDDEILIASHSNGTVIAVLALAAVLRADPELAKRRPQISFLTLGQSIPLCSFLPQAKELRRALQDIAADNAVTWIDISAPRDAACFALTHPLTASGLKRPDQATVKPKLLSVPIGELFSPETFRKTLKHRWLRIHFQYLMAYERPTPYDYFLISAGPLTLARRFADFESKDGFAKFRLFG